MWSWGWDPQLSDLIGVSAGPSASPGTSVLNGVLCSSNLIFRSCIHGGAGSGTSTVPGLISADCQDHTVAHSSPHPPCLRLSPKNHVCTTWEPIQDCSAAPGLGPISILLPAPGLHGSWFKTGAVLGVELTISELEVMLEIIVRINVRQLRTCSKFNTEW